MVPWFYTRKHPSGRMRQSNTVEAAVSPGKLLFSHQLVVLQLFGVDAVRVVDGAINFPHANTLGSKPVQVPHGVKTHITKALREQRQEGL